MQKYVFPNETPKKTVQKPCKFFAKSLNEGNAANAVENS